MPFCLRVILGPEALGFQGPGTDSLDIYWTQWSSLSPGVDFKTNTSQWHWLSLVLLELISRNKGIFKGERSNYILFCFVFGTNVLWPNWVGKNTRAGTLCAWHLLTYVVPKLLRTHKHMRGCGVRSEHKADWLSRPGSCVLWSRVRAKGNAGLATVIWLCRDTLF